jgi:type I restriction enzyme M protein
MNRSATDTPAMELRDRLRSMPQQPSAFVVPLATMIYLRWADFQEAEAEAMAAFDEIDHTPLLPASLHWRCWHDLLTTELPEFFSKKLPSAIQRLEGSHAPIAASLIRLLPAIRTVAELTPAGISSIARWLAFQSFETPNDRRILLEHFDAFADMATSRETGEFRTPSCINDLLAALADPKGGEHLYDPCFGFAGNLIAAYRRVSRDDRSGNLGHDKIALRISGMDINAHSYAVGLARLVLAGIPEPQLEIGNSLEREIATNPRKDGYDLIITNPPWGQRIELRGMNHFPVQTNDGNSLFVQHALTQLRPNGRAVIVVPQGFLYQQGKTTAVRRWLLENHQVEAVVGLPQGAFLPHTAVKAAILVIRRDGGPTKKVRMVDGSAFFEQAKGKNKAATLQPKKLEEIAYAAGHIDKNSWFIEAEMLPDLGYDLSPTRREVSEFDSVMDSLANLVPVKSLRELCEISAGRSIPSQNLIDEPIDQNPIPYLRIGDIEQGQTNKAKSWLGHDVIHGLPPRHRLRAGDVLISKSGTIGKIGVVRNGAVGGIASGGLMVLRPDSQQLDPHYLSIILQSKVYQKWLQSKSSGSVISGLQKQFVESLIIPLPPLQIQHRIAHEAKTREMDGLKQLLQVIREKDQHPLADWSDRSLSFLTDIQNRIDGNSIPLQEIVHTIFSHDFRNVRNQVAHPQVTLSSSEFDLHWVLHLWQVGENLRSLSKVPEGAAQFSLLQRAEYDLQSVSNQITGDNSAESRAQEIVLRLREVLKACREKSLGDVAVTIELKTLSLRAGIRGEITLAITNQSALPLHNFTLNCEDLGFQILPFFLPENDVIDLGIEVDAPKEAGDHQIRIEWNATTLEGQPETGIVTLGLRVDLAEETAPVIDLGPSPYFVSEPVSQKRTDVFVGREETIERIKHQLASGNTVLLEGNRRAGKTSILKQIEGINHIQDRLAVYTSLQATEGDSEVAGMRSEAVWRTLAKSIITGVATLEIDVPLPDGTILVKGAGVGIARACRKGISSEAPWEDFLEYATLIMNLLAQRGLGLVLMIDEFDKLQEGIDNKVTSPQIPENIRYLIQNLSGFSAILTGSRRMQRLRHEYWSALYGLGKQVSVTALEPDAARRLIQKPVEGRLTYTHEAVELLIELTARQPFLIQSLCNQVFELAVENQLRSITATTVNEAASRFVENNEHFASLMDYTETHRRRFIIMLVHKASKGPDLVTFGVILAKLADESIEIAEEDLTNDLRFLQDLELIDYVGDSGSYYTLTVPLMGRWLECQHDYHALLGNARSEQENQS